MVQEGEISTSAARVQKDIVDACVSHYEVFGYAHSALKTLGTSGGSRASDIDRRLTSSLASLDAISRRMLTDSHEWRIRRAVATTAANQCFRVVEIVEAPQTLEACLQAEAYHEALLVVDHVRSLHDESPASDLLSSVLERVEQVLSIGVETLVFPKLSQPITLTACIKLINFMRRLDIPDRDIRQLFLSRKLTWLQGTLTDSAKMTQSPYSSLSKALSLFKVGVSEIVLRYEACFGLCDQEQVTELQIWVSERATSFANTFSGILRTVTSGAEVASLSSQLDHLAPPLGRVSCDITPELLFQLSTRALSIFSSQIHMARSTYEAAMSAQVWAANSLSQFPKTHADNGVPMQLLHFLPLAYAANGIISAINEIRKCAFSCLASVCESLVDDFLLKVATDAQELHQSAFLSDIEFSAVQEFRSLLASVLVPHVVASVLKVFPILDGTVVLSRTTRILVS